MIRSVSIFVAIFLSSPAASQTTCSWVGQLWVCNQSAPTGSVEPFNYSKILQDGQNLVPNWAEEQATLARQRAETQRLIDANEQVQAGILQRENSRRLRQQLGALVADGKCSDAIGVAMRAGDFALAREVRDICK